MDKVTSRAVIGMYQVALEAAIGVEWLPLLSNYFESDQALESYAWLGMPPAMREWLGKRKAHQLREDFFEIRNKEFESTILVQVKDLRRDKLGLIRTRINEHVQRAASHWASLVANLILNGASTLCYDGQYFFDTDHVTGDSAAQSNKIAVDISTLPAEVHGVITNPSSEEAAQAVFEGINQIMSFVDDQNEPMNETASTFAVMAPLGLAKAISSGLSNPRGTGLAEQALAATIRVFPTVRLGAWTDKFAIFRTDSEIKAMIRQEEAGLMTSAKAEGSDFAHDNNAHEYGLNASRNAGYGRWEYACQVTLT